MKHLSRRTILRLAAAAPMALAAQSAPGSPNLPNHLPPPRYTLSVNTELMFPPDMPRSERIERIAAQGMKAFSFWSVSEKDERSMLAAQKRTGLACGSIAGSDGLGWSTGLTKTGFEQAYLDAITRNCEVAKRFGCPNLVIFVGAVQKEIPWDKQYQQIISGLRKAGDIAEKYDLYLCLEPLNRVEMPQMSVLLAVDGFKIVGEVGHPRVKLDYDLYHRQLGEGNVINNLKLGLEKGLIRFVEIGDVPGRKEPGSGELNYKNVFRVLREARYGGFVGMEHGTTSSAEQAMDAARKVSTES